MAAPASPLRPLFTTAPLYPYATSPLSTHLSHSPSDSYYFASSYAPGAHAHALPLPLPALKPEPVPLTFSKVPVPRSATSTDSDALSDGYLSRSPSLLTSLLRGSSTSSSAAPHTAPSAVGSILRRPSGASDDWRAASGASQGAPATLGLGLGLVTVPEQDRAGSSVDKAGISDALVATSNAEAGPSCSRLLGRRKSCLTFAVTPATRSSPSPSSRVAHAAPPSPVPRLPSVDEPDMDDDDDEGYEEDSEDGLSSAPDDDADDDRAVVDPGALYRPSFAQPTWAPGSFAPPILRVPRRRGTAPAGPADLSLSSTETDEPAHAPHAPHVRRCIRIRIRDGSRSADRCSRHRSPPPSASRALSPDPAPPAARSPSAAELCRRRQGCPALSRDAAAASTSTAALPMSRRRATASDIGQRPYALCVAVRPILRAADSDTHAASMRRQLTGLPGGAACGAEDYDARPVRAPATAPASPRATASRPWRTRAASVAEYRRRGSAPACVEVDAVSVPGQTQRGGGDAREALRRGSR
ncbi:hypothetical protein Q5752_000199 [Cryptotrichosporon argae]